MGLTEREKGEGGRDRDRERGEGAVAEWKEGDIFL